MALSASTTWEVRTTGSASNSGGFNVSNVSMATDLAATVATGSSPVVTSASYTFVAGDVGAYLFVKSGTNWVPGWYAIASVSAGAATLTASIGSVSLYGGATLLNAATGCASTASPTGGTWSVDYSQQASAQFAYTDLVIGSTTTQLTSSAKPFGKNCVGNLIKITSGTGFTTGWFEVVSVSSVTATVDRSAGTASSTGGSGNLGGCLDGPATLSAAMIASNKAFVQTSGGYTSTATITFSQTCNSSNTVMDSRLIGYTSYRGDNGMAVLTLATSTGLTGLSFTGNSWSVKNLSVNCSSLATSTAFAMSGNYGELRNCKAQNFTKFGINVSATQNLVDYCEVTGGTSAATTGISPSTESWITNCWVHDNACPGISNATAYCVITSNLVTNNSGASSDGISVYYGNFVLNNTCYSNGRHGIANDSLYPGTLAVRNNLLVGNGGFGLLCATGAGNPATPFWDGNAFYANTSGTRSNGGDAGSVNAINGVAPYVNTLDVILTASPFVAAASNDYRLNTATGGGAACRGHGLPASWPGNTLTVSAPDMGCAQHADPTVFAVIGCSFIKGASREL